MMKLFHYQFISRFATAHRDINGISRMPKLEVVVPNGLSPWLSRNLAKLDGRMLCNQPTVVITERSPISSWPTDGRSNARTQARTNGQIDGRTVGQTDGQTSGRTSRT